MNRPTSIVLSLFCVAMGASACANARTDTPTPVAARSESSGATASVIAPSGTSNQLSAPPQRAPTVLSGAALEDDERVNASEPLLAAPPEPAVSPALAPQVDAMQSTVARTSECWNSAMYMRIAHAAPRECSEWFDQLARGGEASAIAIGRFVSGNAHQFNQEALDRLVEILARTEAASGVPYMLRRMHTLASTDARTLSDSSSQSGGAVVNVAWALDRLVYAFERTTGYPVSTFTTWDNEDAPTARRAAVQRALRFWEQHGTNGAQWAAFSDARLRSWLGADGARIMRAAVIIHDRSASAALVPVARVALERLEATTQDASLRANARSLLAQYRNEGTSPAGTAL